MSLIAKSPRFFTGKPDILNTENRLSFSLPLINRGSGPAINVQITDILLGPATRLIPALLPVTIGNLAVRNLVPLNARFDASALISGIEYLIEVQGTYESRGATYQFAVSHQITIPAPVAPPIRLLNARVEAAIKSKGISYSLFNDEAWDSPHHINAFSLEIFSPTLVTGVPEGWDLETDHQSYVLWYTPGRQSLDLHDIAPGTSLGGFEVRTSKPGPEMSAFSLTAWDHDRDQSGLVSLGAIVSSSRKQ